MATNDEISTWQASLQDAFSYNGLIGGEYLPSIFEIERSHGEMLVKKYAGHRTLADSFQDYFASTLTIPVKSIDENDYSKGTKWYPYTLSVFLTMFRRLRAAETLFSRGYPMAAYSLLRDLRDQAFSLCARANALFSQEDILGVADVQTDSVWTDIEHNKVHWNKVAVEKKITELLVGKESGLDDDSITELQMWSRLFNHEVHGSQFTQSLDAGKWLFDKDAKFSLGPLPNDTATAMYINRFTEIGWMILRLLPFLQFSEEGFNKRWVEKWRLLDDSFLFSVEDFGTLGKKIAPIFIQLINTKFGFNEDLRYFE